MIMCLFSGQTQPVTGEYEVCIDGGILCNYPIRCFDGKDIIDHGGVFLSSKQT